MASILRRRRFISQSGKWEGGGRRKVERKKNEGREKEKID